MGRIIAYLVPKIEGVHLKGDFSFNDRTIEPILGGWSRVIAIPS